MSTLLIGFVFLALALGLVAYFKVFQEKPDDPKDDPPLSAIPDTNIEAKKEEAEDKRLKIAIYVGSQTGTAQEFAETLQEEGIENNFNCVVVDLEDYEPEMFKDNERAIFCLATYGEGDPADNAMEFDNWLKEEKRTEEFEGVRFTVFGLGNKQYEHYNSQGRLMNKRMESLCGAAGRMYPYGEGDDDASLEEDFEAWKAKLWVSLRRSEYGEKVDDSAAAAPTAVKRPVLPFVLRPLPSGSDASAYATDAMDNRPIALSSKAHFNNALVKVVCNRELRQDLKFGSTRHVELDVKGTDLAAYQTADNLAVVPCNDDQTVEALSSWLGYDLNMSFELDPNAAKSGGPPKLIFPTPCTVRDALTNFCDLNAPPARKFLKALAAYATGEEQQRLLLWSSSTPEGHAAYKQHIVEPKRSLAAVLRYFKGLDLPLGAFLQLCPRIVERLYTIASSPAAHPNRIHIAVSIVAEEVPGGGMFRGLCSTFLDNRRTPDRSGPRPSRGAERKPWPSVRVFVRPSTFKAPQDTSLPIIMVGPGTGIAPMMAMLQERQAILNQGGTLGPAILFFGCCNRDVDFIYRDELQAFVDSGALTKLHLAFSREQAKKVYVQHRLMEQSKALWQLVSRCRAHIYVCGGISMGSSVAQTFEQMAQDEGGLSTQAAKSLVADLKSNGRYIQELWS